MQVSVNYVEQKIIPALDGGIDYGADRIVVAQFPQLGTQLIWQSGCKRWKDNMDGWVYMTGKFEYQTIGYRVASNSGFNSDLTEGQWSDYGLDSDEDRPKLNARWVSLMIKKLAFLTEGGLSPVKAIPYSVVESHPKYKRGKTLIIEWQDEQDELDELHSAMVSLGVL